MRRSDGGGGRGGVGGGGGGAVPRPRGGGGLAVEHPELIVDAAVGGRHVMMGHRALFFSRNKVSEHAVDGRYTGYVVIVANSV